MTSGTTMRCHHCPRIPRTRVDTIPVLVNPTSGGGRARKAVPEFVRALTTAGIRTRVQASTSSADLQRMVREEVARGAETVVVCGGDGTIHLAIQELAGTPTALGILPVGTGDDNARTLGVPLGDATAAARVVATGRTREIDLGHVTAADGTSRFFVGVLSAGFDSFVNERANRMTWPKGKARYLVAILGELRIFTPAIYQARIDDMSLTDGAMLIAIGNGISYGGGMKICPAALPDDGLLNVTWLHAVKTSTFLRVFPSVFSGSHVDRPEVSTYTGRRISLSADGQLAYADGERVGPLPIEVDIRPGTLRVLV